MAFGLGLILINLVGGFVIGYAFRAATEQRYKLENLH
jgi:fluoride ion exporter CrcB/FEX